MHLYLLVWECEEYAMEAEWLHFVSDKRPENREQVQMAKDFMNGEAEPEDWNITNYWLNEVTSVDGYKISLEKA